MSPYFSNEDFEKYINGNPAETTSKLFYTDSNGEVIEVKRDKKVSDIYLMNFLIKVKQLEDRVRMFQKVLIGKPFEMLDDEDYNQLVGLAKVSVSGVKKLKDMLEGELAVNEVEINEEDLPF